MGKRKNPTPTRRGKGSLVEDHLRVVAECMAEGLLFLDADSHISYLNAAAVRMLGPESPDWVGEDLERIHPELHKTLALMTDAFSHGHRQTITGTIPLSERTLEAHFSHVLDALGEYAGLVVLFQDRTQADEFRSHMMHAEKMAVLGELAAAVAHEINNPLGGILESIRIIQDKSCDYERMNKFFPLIVEGLEQIRRSVQRMLSFSQRHVIEKRPTCIEEIVLQSVEFLGEHARREHATTIELDLSSSSTFVTGDPHALSQVFVNLINNALDSLKSDGPRRVWVTCRRLDSGEVVVAVSDTGCGIPPEDRARVFDPFFTTKPTGKGTGLGLSICANIVSEHGGTITLAARAEGGTTFTVKLPTRPAPTAQDANRGKKRDKGKDKARGSSL